MSEYATFRINLKTGEIEISGSEQFVEARIESIRDILDLVSESTSRTVEIDDPTNIPSSATQTTQTSSGSITSGYETPETFGEWMNSFRDNITDIDKALIAAYFVQSLSDQNEFKTAEVNELLKDHGVKLSNPSRSLKLLEDKKYLFQTRKAGRISYKRVSNDGQAHLETLKRER